ncbi:hypothetical protein ACEN2P_08155 [Pedobacter psychrotolerans]|uniref:hypothetical protein n=1 Tax=Pedobacter psychrotolerans TaxID=1843235 RepID=UPI003F9BFFB2
MLFKTPEDLYDHLSKFLDNSTNVSIYVPYIKFDSLKSLIDNKIGKVSKIIVRWEPRDLIIGASDLEIYPYLKSKGITLYRNKRLHLKAFVENYERSFIGSANISQRALNFPQGKHYNYELATIIDPLSFEDKLYFSEIEADSTLVNDYIYDQFLNQLPAKKLMFPNESDFNIDIQESDKNFLISSLPLTYSVETLYRIYDSYNSIHNFELNCALHDLALYKIPLGLSEDLFFSQLKQKFFNHPFTRAFLENLEGSGEVYFGAAKDWIHKNCSNVPLPMKWEITENIQILYRWIIKLGDGVYSIDRPSFSERLFIKK